MKVDSKVKFTGKDDENIPTGSEGTVTDIWLDECMSVNFGPVIGEWTVPWFELKEIV